MSEKIENSFLEELGKSILTKYVSEEIMTKNELDNRLEAVMGKYTKHIDKEFNEIKTNFSKEFNKVSKEFSKVDVRYNWIIGLVITSSLSALGILISIYFKIH
jgi:hypothetical protein